MRTNPRLSAVLLLLFFSCAASAARPNILFCISDDQSYDHTSANGDPVVKTPAFDRIAREGLRFEHAFCDAPTCGPSRSAVLTGQPIWRLEEAGNIHSTLPAKFKRYPEILQQAGYVIGSTGKAWSPGRLEPGGREVNPAGPIFAERKLQPPFRSISNKDYAGNFEDFLSQLKADQPFCFWLGTHESHRGFQEGVGKQTGKDLAKIVVPPVLPDNDIVRSDIADYLVEVEYFDAVVARAIASLEERSLLDNTIVIVTSDHGMPFPRAKASLYDLGSRVPLAIRWPKGIKNPGRVVDSFGDVPQSTIVGYNECATRFTNYTYDHTAMTQIFHPLLALIASASDKELARYVEYLKRRTRFCVLASLGKSTQSRRRESDCWNSVNRLVGPSKS